MLAKELLFDKFINILCEPKVRKSSSKSVKNSVKSSSVATTNDITDITDITEGDIQTQPLNLDATIKITKKIKTKTIVSTAYIKNDKKKKIWEENNENCKDKDYEIIALIKKIIAYNSNNIYYITF